MPLIDNNELADELCDARCYRPRVNNAQHQKFDSTFRFHSSSFCVYVISFLISDPSGHNSHSAITIPLPPKRFRILYHLFVFASLRHHLFTETTFLPPPNTCSRIPLFTFFYTCATITFILCILLFGSM